MPDKKPWTVMVYLAADNNLTNFGIDSLKQMKAVCGDSVNIVAEFYSGPRRPTKRYLFDHRTILGSIEQDVINKTPAKDAGDPANLTAFVTWAANHYEAEHYFLIIWGHGAGTDDDFPRDPNRPRVLRHSFVMRHPLLNPGTTTKGRLLDAPKGTLLDSPKGTLLDSPKGVIEEALKDFVDEAGELVLPELIHQIDLALKHDWSKLEHGKGSEALLEMEIRHVLENGILAAFRESVGKDVHDRILSALSAGLHKAAEKGVFNDIQRNLAQVFRTGKHHAAECFIHEAVHTGSLTRLFRKVVYAMQDGYADSDPAPTAPPNGTKSVAFSDHPASYLSNLKLKEAFQNACKSLPSKSKIDIIGMDACDMNMLEIGYELRDCADYLVASQGPVPDASWPYDSILQQLVHNPRVLPRDLACITTTAYVLNYRDYVNQPVALSVLDLQKSDQVRSMFEDFTRVMEESIADHNMRQAIRSARRKAQSFGENQFVDIIDFCQNLAEEPAGKAAGMAALSLIGKFQPFIVYNQCSEGLQRCNGTSIYFPEFDPANLEHQDDLAKLYSYLDFAKLTGWGGFLKKFRNQQMEEWKAARKAEAIKRQAALESKAAKAKKPRLGPEPPRDDDRTTHELVAGNGAPHH